MRKSLKIILIGVSLFVGLPIVYLIGYDFLIFKPNLPSIKAAIQDSHPFYGAPSGILIDLATIAEGEDGIKRYVSRRLVKKYGEKDINNLRWHFDNAVWTILLRFHLSDADIFTLWCQMAPCENGVGLNESALYHFNREINQLNTHELMTILAIVKAPYFYKRNPDKLHERVNKLLGNYMEIYEKK